MSKINKLLTLFLIAVIVLGASVWIPKFRPFGSSTTFGDSTNYININKGLNIPNDSLRVGKYLFVGDKGGGIYLDTNKAAEIIFDGFSMQFINNKENGSTEFWIGEKSSEYYWYKSEDGTNKLKTPIKTLFTVSCSIFQFFYFFFQFSYFSC